MGGFIVGIKAESASSESARPGEITFETLGFQNGERLSMPDGYAILYPAQQEAKANYLRFPNGDFIGVTGNIFYKGRHNSSALAAVYEEFSRDAASLDEALGHYAIVLYKNGKLHVFSDRTGAFKIFYCQRLRRLATSFLVLASALGKPTLNHQAVYEFVTSGAVLGDDSLINEITTLPRQAMAVVENRTITISASRPALPRRDNRSREELLEEADRHLATYFDTVANTFGNNVCCSLTGGYDSRLIFAHLRRRDIKPRLILYQYVDNDPNATVAAHIAKGEGCDIDIIHPEDELRIEPSEFPEIVRRNFLSTDGYLYPGIFDNGIEQRERKARTANGTVFLHGSGGEVFRNFFHLPDRSFSAMQVVQTMYGKFDPRICGPMFDKAKYRHAVAGKMKQLICHDAPSYDRQTVEWLYPNFRGRSWFGRESTINNWFGASLMPFYDLKVTDFGASIPVGEKYSGSFEAELIARAHPRMASYMSEYGHSFMGRPPLSTRWKDRLKTAIPPAFRPLLYAINERRRRMPSYRYLEPAYTGGVFAIGIYCTTSLFNPRFMTNIHQRSRMLTVEYLAQRLNVLLQ
jgi:hypothetical protein